MNTPAAVAAIIVTHHPQRLLSDELVALATQVRWLVIVDNGSSKDELETAVALSGMRAELIQLGKNKGIGAAHNVGIHRGRLLGATHVLLMDQDSVPNSDMVEQLLKAESQLLGRGVNVGAVGPVYHDERLSRSWPFFRMTGLGMRGYRCSGAPYVFCDLLISSGTLIRMKVMDAVGGMNEFFFLEHVDTDWSLRARFAGFELYGVCNARMNHKLGDATIRVPLTRHRVQLYRPYRHYYVFRNALLLWRERHAKLPWKLNEVKRLLARLIFLPLFVPPRGERLRFMLLGLWHGLRRRSGPLES